MDKKHVPQEISLPSTAIRRINSIAMKFVIKPGVSLRGSVAETAETIRRISDRIERSIAMRPAGKLFFSWR